jgi:hypothetical protein
MTTIGGILKSSIPYPSRLSEHEVQTRLFNELISLGIDARCQVSSADGKCLFDIVVFKDRLPILIIEVKRSFALLGGRKGNQIHKYRQYGIKVISCQGPEAIRSCIESAKGKMASINRGEM